MWQSTNKSRRRKVEEIFDAALELDAQERAGFVAHACGDDEQLHLRIEALLAAHARLQAEGHGQTPMAMAVPTRMSQQEPSAPRLNSGACIRQYEIIRELGCGGMGTVYLARDTKLGRRVAIKLLRRRGPELTARFITEARATARCSHENIVVIHDVDEHHGIPFLVLEYLKGRPLTQFLDSQPMPVSRALRLVIPVVQALGCAHAHRIVHRDLKPENIFLTDSGTIKVLDFGIAKLIQDRRGADELAATALEATLLHSRVHTGFGVLVGTLPYMSPEQWNGAEVDERTDIWAIGILLYTMLTGEHPLAPLSSAALETTGVLDQPMPSARDARVTIPPRLASVIDQCLRKRKEERMPHASTLLAALEELLPGHAARALCGDESPYAGLAPFQEADAHRFFGRSRDVTTVLEWLRTRPLLGIVGPSGVGKSSFVRAGIIPALKHLDEDWEAFVIRPGRQPMAALAGIAAPLASDAIPTACGERVTSETVMHRLYAEPGYLGAILRARTRASGTRIALFVDQFEELYTLTRDPREHAAFTACLAALGDDAAAPLRVIFSVRVDFLHRVAEACAFMAELGQSLYFLAPPDREGLREAITRPAAMVSYAFESAAMVEQMLDTLATTPGALPLLQFAATRLWDARDQARRLLTARSYEAIGGIDGALAGHADAVLTALAPQDQALVRAIFLQLVTPERTRAIALVKELRELSPDPDAIQRVLDHLVGARLLVVRTADADGQGEDEDEATAEIVHESLLHRWPMLAHWLDENQEDVVVLEQLRTTARQWHAKGRPVGLLWRGESMRDAERWHRRYRGALPTLQREYLDAVFALAARAARARRLLVLGVIAVLSVLVIAAGFALVWIRDAEQEARAAEVEVRKQLELVQAKERERLAAERVAARERERAEQAGTEVAMSKEELRQANQELREALSMTQRAEELARQESARAQAEAERAHDAAEDARRASQELQQTNGKLQELNAELQHHLMEEKARLAEERARVAELQKKYGEVGAALK
jgi:serine/threonine protein kinase